MASIEINSFKAGLDARRLPEASPPGTLALLQDGHINRGGEIEQRAAFVPTYALPAAQTVGMAYAGSQIVVFGEAAAPTVPSGVIYQQLVHPLNSALRLARVLSFEYFSDKIYAIAQFEDGGVYHYYDGARVTDWNDKRARSSVTITGGLAGGTINSIRVNGLDILGAVVAYTGDPTTTAQAVADQINAYLTSPQYVAAAFRGVVSILAATDGTTPNGYAVVVSTTSVSYTGAAALAGGIVDTATYQSGEVVKTGNQKLFVLSGGDLHFSGIADPTKWFSTESTGAGFITMSDQASDADVLTGLAKYQNYYAFFSPRTIQIWYNDPDPSLNKQLQVLANTGTLSPLSVVQYGDNDVFYLDESGIRSIRARDASNAAATTDAGVPVDPLIIAALEQLTDSQRKSIVSVIEPSSGRYWLAIGSTVYVFSAFIEASITAWSAYALPFSVEQMFMKPSDRKVYVRSGDTIYVYGGQGRAPVYDDTPVVAWLSYLDGGHPAIDKTFTGLDVVCRGEWEIRAAMNVSDFDASDLVARVTGTTYSGPDIAGMGEFSHIQPRLTSLRRPAGGGPAVLSALAIHYEGVTGDE